MARGRRVFQRQYEKGGERERKLTLNLLLPHLSVNFTLVSFFVQTFHCDSIDCPLLLHKRRQSRLHTWAVYKCSSKFQSYSCFRKLKTFQLQACLHGAVTKKKKFIRRFTEVPFYTKFHLHFSFHTPEEQLCKSNYPKTDL